MFKVTVKAGQLFHKYTITFEDRKVQSGQVIRKTKDNFGTSLCQQANALCVQSCVPINHQKLSGDTVH